MSFKKNSLLVIFVIALVFAQVPALPKFEQYGLENLPPVKQEKNNVIYSYRSIYNEKYFNFEITIDNQSLEKEIFDIGRDVVFNLEKPNVLNFKSERLIILPNEKVKVKVFFNRRKLKDKKIYNLRIKDVLFYLRYHDLVPLNKKINGEQLLVLDYQGKDTLLLSGLITSNILLVNNSGVNIYQAVLLHHDGKSYFEKLDYKYWYLVSAAAVSSKNMILIKNSPRDDFKMFKIKNLLAKNDYLSEKVTRPHDQYLIGLMPANVKKGENVQINLYVKYMPSILRVTATIFGKKYQLKQRNNNLWHTEIFTDSTTEYGDHLVKVYIKDEAGVVILTENLKVI